MYNAITTDRARHYPRCGVDVRLFYGDDKEKVSHNTSSKDPTHINTIFVVLLSALLSLYTFYLECFAIVSELGQSR